MYALPENSELNDIPLARLNDLSGALLESLEIEGRLSAALRFFVPRLADWAYITLPDERGEPRIAGRLHPHRFPGSDEAAAHIVSLDAHGERLGALHLGSKSEPLDQQDEALLSAGAHRCAQALRNSRLYEREQRVALTFQNAALNVKLPQIPGFSFDAIYEAGRAEALVGGDWYDAFLLADGRFVISIGDVMGSGLAAAVAMVNVRQTLRGVAHVHPDPALMLQAADKTLRAQYPERYVTTFVGLIDPVTQSCTYVNAGHPPPFLRSPDGYVQQLRGHGLLLGMPEFSSRIETHHVHLPEGAMLVLYTDGLTEASRDVLMGELHLRNALEDLQSAEPHPARRLYELTVPGHARDDIAILTMQLRGGPSIRRWRFDPRWHDVSMRIRCELGIELGSAGLDPVQRFNYEMIFAEIMANLVRYAPGVCEVLLEKRPDALILHVIDKGPGFQFTPRLPHDLFSESGRGIFLISQLAHEFVVEPRAGGGSHARVVFALSPLEGKTTP